MSSRNHFRNLGPIEHLGNLIDSMVNNIEDDLQQALNDFEDLAQSILENDPDDFFTVNDSLLTLIEVAIESESDLAGLVPGAFDTWSEHLQENLNAIVDLFSRLYDMFSDQATVFRTLIEALTSTFDGFPELFHRLCKEVATQPTLYLDGLEKFLLPLFYAGLSVFGAEQGVQALIKVLTDSSSVLSNHVTCNDLGLLANDLPALQVNMLEAPTFRLPRAVWMMTAMFDAMRQASSYANLLPEPVDIPNPFLQTMLGPVVEVIAQAVSDYLNTIDSLLDALIERMLQRAENDFEIEWLVLQLARFTPVGILFVVVGSTYKLLTSPAPWLSLMLNPIEEDPDLQVLRLSAPSASNRYILFSDIHRDAVSDARPPYQFGSIDHFMPNRGQYLEVLKHYSAIPEYTIIEIGDCEELWFYRDFSLTPAEKLQEIVQTHQEIYALLRELHAQGRYVRIQGNHDSYLRQTETFAVLRDAIESDGAMPFEIFDFAIIEGVKSMQDVPFYLGLDSEPNSERKPMLLGHGHQWDFWNCEANNILGKMIVSAVVTPLDMLDDPLRDLAGLSHNGSPLVNFKQIIGDLPVFNSWQNYEPGVVRMDQIQHMDDQARRLTDDVMYSETLASLMGMLIPIAPGPGDVDCPLLNLDGRCLFNLMTLGHTHNPHNQPYWDLKVLPYVKEALVGLQDAIASATFGLFDVELGLVKSYYLNTGMTGWYEECIWAIDLGDESHNSGQPKLVNWTCNTRVDKPNHMDWELPHVPRDGRPIPGDRVEGTIRDWLAMLVDMVNTEKDKLIEALSHAPLEVVVREAVKTWKPVDFTFDFSNGAAGDTAGPFLFQVMLGVLAGRDGAFTIDIRLPPGLTKPLARALKAGTSGKRSKRDNLAAAIVSLAVVQEIGRTGLSLELGPQDDPDGHKACLGLLFVLAQMQQGNDRRFSIDLNASAGAIKASVNMKATRMPHLPSKPPKSLPVMRSPNLQRLGLMIEAQVAGLETPLAGWQVELHELQSRTSRRLLRTRTNKLGRAEMLRLQPRLNGYHLSGDADIEGELVLRLLSPDGKEAMRMHLDPTRPAELVTLTVNFEVLREIGFYPSKLRRSTNKIQQLCDRWKKRLHNKNDQHAESDLCLQDLMLDIMGGLENPRTPMQKQAARLLRLTSEDTKPLKQVSELARKTRASLKDCLGDDYHECDGGLSIEAMGEKLLHDCSRFSSLNSLFDDPVPDPLDDLPATSPGRGIGVPINWDKVCLARYNQDLLDDGVRQAMQPFMPDGLVLAQPSINLIEIWDGSFRGGDIVRMSEVHDKLLNIRVLKDLGGNLSLEDRAVDMDVTLDDVACLIVEADQSGRQILATDVSPGQRVILYGSGFVSEKARLQVDFRHWESTLSDGRLVPDSNVLPADGFVNLEAGVFGNQIPLTDGADSEHYNGDKVIFEWPETASREGIYRLRLSFVNESEYPSKITQNDDCSIVVDHSDVKTQEIFFVVLPAVEQSPLRAKIDEVECVNLTDPESILGVPYPDDLLLLGSALKHRIIFSSDSNHFEEEIIPLVPREDSILLTSPGIWTTNMRLFPENPGFDQLAHFESVIASFDLLEVEGDLDKFIAQLVYLAALVAMAIIVAAVITVITAAIIIALVGLGIISLGTAEIIAMPIAAAFLAAVYGFIFGAAFTAFLALQDSLNTVVDGSDSIVQGNVQLDGGRLNYRLSPVRFHRLLFPLDTGEVDASDALATLEETFANDILGGSYKVLFNIETAGD